MRVRSFLVAVVVAGALCVQACGTSSDGSEEEACFYQGQVRPAGSEFPAGDGCNTCTCHDDLSITCTELACPDSGIPDAGIDGDAAAGGDGGAADAGDLDAGDPDAG